MGSYGERGLPTLLRLLEDPDEIVRHRAAGTLANIASGPAIRALLNALHEWQEPNAFNVSESVNAALIRVGAVAIPYLEEFLITAPPNSQVRAMRILEALGGSESVRPYTNATDAQVREVAFKIIDRAERWKE